MTIHRYYRPAKNPDRAHFPGVPWTDLTQAEYDALPTWLQASIDASEMYQEAEPTPAEKRADTLQLKEWAARDGLAPDDDAPGAPDAPPQE